MKNSILIIAAAALLSACGSSNTNNGAGTGQITLTGDSTFTTPHHGQTMRGALIRVSDNTTLDIQKTTVAAIGTNPGFAFTFAPTVDLSAAYKVRYWVDFNSNDQCDAPPTDHQWEVDVPTGQSAVTVTHNATFTNVCTTFTFPLTFIGDSSFTAPHAGQAVKAALVKGSATTALDTQSGTVAALGTNPAFSLTFTPRLVIGEAYSVKLWIDVNGNTTCDPPPPGGADHQWTVDNIPHDLSNFKTSFTYAHNTTFTNVCSFFP
jgi:hypothetical protein